MSDTAAEKPAYYELQNPSDKITFLADTKEIATVITVIL